MGFTRRELIRGGSAVAGGLMLPLGGHAAQAGAGSPKVTDGPYGPLQPADPTTGVMVPKGFTVREIARGGQPVGLTGYPWHPSSDGSGSFAQADGSWILASNSELPGGVGGASAIHFSKNGDILDAYRILDGTDTNCGGGTTPWGTWLSGEEIDRGRVLECDPKGQKPAVARPALGLFSHEYILCHLTEKKLYLTEDEGGGGLYRFTPVKWGDLSSGLLEIATLRPDGKIAWSKVPDPLAKTTPTRDQVKGASRMKRPEGLCIDQRSGVVFFCESSAGRVFAFDPKTSAYEIVYAEDDYEDPILTDTDNIEISPINGDLFVCEDAGTFDICLITPEGEISRFVNLSGAQHGQASTPASSETTGPSFDPSGTRFYFASQRAGASGALYEVTGPWRKRPQKQFQPRLPKVRLDARRLVRRSFLSRSGLPVRVSLATLSDVELELRSGDRTLGKVARKDLMPGRVRLTVRLSRSSRAGVRELNKVTLVATVTDAVGRKAVARRSVTVVD